MRLLKLALSAIAVALLAGCAHPIVISPDISKIEADAKTPRIEKNVGLYMDPQLRDAEVITAGGGGDSVSYKPYRDIETAFFKMLGNVFRSVSVLTEKNDALAVSKHDLSYIVSPNITTTSSSPSPFTWPPTLFQAILKTTVNDVSGKTVANVVVTSEGRAEFEEFKSDFSLSGRRAMLDAILKTQDALLKAKELR